MTVNYVRSKLLQMGKSKHIANMLSLTQDYDRSKYYLEQEGDLDEMYKILCIGEEEIIRMSNMQKFVMHAHVICIPLDLYNIPRVKEFRSSYPSLYRTFEVWAWG